MSKCNKQKIEKILSVHYPKAGGSSFKRTLSDAFPDIPFIELYYDDPVDPCSLSAIAPALAKKDAEKFLNSNSRCIIHGHFTPRKFEGLDFDLRVSIIRHPIAWIFSLYRYWQKVADKGEPGHYVFELFKRERPTIEELAAYTPIRNCLSTTYFGGCNLEDFDLIGIQERYSGTLKRMALLFNADLNEFTLNTTSDIIVPPEKNPELSVKTRQHLESILSADIRFYNRVCELFW
jgi:hypothetical protein